MRRRTSREQEKNSSDYLIEANYAETEQLKITEVSWDSNWQDVFNLPYFFRFPI